MSRQHLRLIQSDAARKEADSRICVKCNVNRPLHEFHKEKGGKDGRRLDCKDCKNKAYRDLYKNRAIEYNARRKEYRKNNIIKAREIDRKSSLKRNYGLTVTQYEEMLAKQNGVCAICKKPETTISHTGKVSRLPIDHCHITGAVRGLLCHRCNRALGLIGDNVETLICAASYIAMKGA